MAVVHGNGSQSGNLTPEQQAALEQISKDIGKGLGGKVGQRVLASGQNIVKRDNAIGSVETNNFEYGGAPGGAAEAAARYRAQAEAAQGRAGVQADFGLAGESRAAQLRMADMMANRAMGRTPSIAGMMADRQMGQAAAEQSSAAASARGPAALALAQQGAAANTAAMQSNISGQAQINAANERMQAEQAAMGAYTGMRGQDFGQAMGQAGLDDAQKGRNDAMQLGMTANEMGVNQTQLAAQMNKQAQMSGNAINMEGIITDRKAGNAAKERAVISAIGSSAEAGAKLASDERAKVVSTWGDMPAARPEGDAPATWGGGPGTSAVDAHADQARRALAENDVKTGYKSSNFAFASPENADRGDGGEGARAAAAAKEEAEKEKKKGKALGFVGALAGLAGALIGADGRSIPASARARYQPQMIPLPQQNVLSDMRSKEPSSPNAPIFGSSVEDRGAALKSADWVSPMTPQQRALMEQGNNMLAGYRSQLAQGPMVSDDRAKLIAAKQEAFQQGADATIGGGMPEYMFQKGEAAKTGGRAASTTVARPAPGAANATPMAASNRALEASPYTYKPQFAAMTGQEPGEQNVGPMAQKMAADPVAATVVEKDPNTGLLTLDRDKLAKVTAGGVAELQRQIDTQQAQIRSLMARRIGGKR